MPRGRIHRRIDSLLDGADDAVTRDDRETVRRRASAALLFDGSSADAPTVS